MLEGKEDEIKWKIEGEMRDDGWWMMDIGHGFGVVGLSAHHYPNISMEIKGQCYP